jgi:arylsulfatase
MTGRHPIRSGTTKVVWGMLYGLTQWERTIAEILSDSGYATGMFGKWHLGEIPGRLPIDQGFGEWFGIPNTTDESLYTSHPQYDASEGHAPSIMEGFKGRDAKVVGDYDVDALTSCDGSPRPASPSSPSFPLHKPTSRRSRIPISKARRATGLTLT